MVGASVKSLAQWSKLPSFPRPDHQDRIDAVEFFAWWLERKADKSFRDTVASALGAVVSAETAVSPEDEYAARRARAKAMLEELKLEQEQKTLVRVSDVQQHIETLTRCLRSGCEVLQRRFGQEAADILERSISEAETEIGRLEQ